MSLTFADMVERLKQIDEISLLEILDLSAEDLVERFEDRILAKWEALEEELGDTDEIL